MTGTPELTSPQVITLLLTSPDDGRRPSVQQIGPLVRAAGLDDLVRAGAVDPGAEDLRIGQPPAALAAMAQTFDTGHGWRRALTADGKQVVDLTLSELADAGLITHRSGGFLRPARTTMTPSGVRERAAIIQAWVDGTADQPALNQQALLETAGLLRRATDKRLGSPTGKPTVAPVIQQALKRAMLDRRIPMVS